MRGDFVNFCFFLSFTVSRARSEIIFRLIKGVKSVCGWNFGHFFIFQRDWMEPFKKEKMTKMTYRSSCCLIFEWIFFYILYRSACVAWGLSWLANSGSSDSSSRSKSVAGNSQRQNEFDRCWREAADWDLNYHRWCHNSTKIFNDVIILK